MTVLLILALSQHAVISARAGLVTYGEGIVGAAAHDHVGGGNALITGASGRSEMMLNPDSYLRILSNSRVRLESDELDHIELAIERGAAVADIRELDGDLPIRIRIGGVDVRIHKNGLYLFEQDRITVLDGELRIGEPETRLKKGRSLVRNESVLTEVDADDDLENHPLIRWTEARRKQLAPPPRPPRPRSGRGLRIRF